MKKTDVLEKLNRIPGIMVTEALFGYGMENRISMEIRSPEDYLKWDYFHEKLHEAQPEIKISKHYPKVRWVFPFSESNLENSLKDFSAFLDKRFYEIEKPPRENITIIAKVTNLCNLDCQYCYDKPFRDKLGHNGFLNLESLEKAISMAAKHAEQVTILWHGGEPTLCGLDYYRKIYEEILPKYPYTEYDISIQTNGTLLNAEWFEFAKKHNMDIGSSYNATQEDLRMTKEANALGSREHNIYSVLANIEEARKHNVSIGVIDVLTKENHHKVIDIYEFYKKIGVNACFNEIHKAGEATQHDLLFETREEIEMYEKNTAAYFAYWINDQDERHFADRYASHYIQLLMIGDGGVCNYSGRCIYHWVGLNSNGDLYPCDRPLGPKYRIGNIIEFDSFMDVFSTPAYQRYAVERSTKIRESCSQCVVFPYCKGGCPMKDIDENRTAAKPNGYACRITKANLLSAYRALHMTDIETCNASMRTFLITNCLFLPKEIPVLLEKLGITGRFPNLHYDADTASFSSTEFEVFQAINSPNSEDQLCLDLDYDERSLGSYHGPRMEDNRFERAIELLKEKAEYLQYQLNCSEPQEE